MVSRERMPRIFISYDHHDADFVLWLAEALENLGHNIWLDRSDILGGVQTFDIIQKALDASQVMLLVITPNSLKSRLINSEWTYFFSERDKKLIPIMLQPPEPPEKINFMLASLQHVDFSREERETALSILQNTLQSVYGEVENGRGRYAGNSLPHSYGPDDQWGLKDELSAANAGLVQIHLDFPRDRYVDWLRQARQRIMVLNTWSHLFSTYDRQFVNALRSSVGVHVLLLDPSSWFAKQRSHDLHPDDEALDEDEVPKNIRASIRQLATFNPEVNGGDLELRLYNVLPSFSIQCVDDRALIGFFPHAARTTSFPLLEIRMESPFGQYVDAEFEQIWNRATSVDLSPKFPDSILEVNQALTEPLSARELEILRYINDGLSNQEIANRLVVTLATIKKHINNLYSKLGVTTRTQAIRRARELGLT